MTIHIINNLSYDKITIEIDNNSYTIQKSESINISSDKSQNQLSVTVLDKSNHYFDLPALLTLSFGRKSSWCEVFCKSILVFNTNNDKCIIELKDNEYQTDKRHIFKAVEFVTTDSQIEKTEYLFTDVKSVKKKHIVYNLLVPMLTPLLIIDIILFCIYGNIGLLFGAVFCICVFTLPGIIDIIKFNNRCDDKSVLEKL